MANPPTHTIAFTGGDTVKFSFQIKDSDPANPLNPPIPRNLTGWTAEAQVRQTPTAEEILGTWTIVQPLDASGIVHMKIPGTVTQPWTSIKSLISDVQLTDPAGDPVTILRIELLVAQDVTRD